MSDLVVLLIIGAGIIYLGLGALHLRYTFFGSRFHPHDAGLKEKMENATLRITRQTTLWKAWMGFNASHSTGAIFFGFVLIYASLAQPWHREYLVVLLGVSIIHSSFYTWLARKYWFSIPFMGCLISTLFLLAAGLLFFINPYSA